MRNGRQARKIENEENKNFGGSHLEKYCYEQVTTLDEWNDYCREELGEPPERLK